MISSKHCCLSSLLSQSAFRNCRDSLDEMFLDGVVYESAIVEFFFFFACVAVQPEVNFLISIFK